MKALANRGSWNCEPQGASRGCVSAKTGGYCFVKPNLGLNV